MMGARITITPEQEAYLAEHYGDTRNDVLMEAVGLKFSTFHRTVRALGLKKTPEFMKEVQRSAQEAARKWHRINRGKLPKKALPEQLKKYQFKPGESPKDRIGAERWAEASKKAHDRLEQTRREEKARAHFGLPRRTKLRVVRQPRQKHLDRHYLKKRGYVLDEENLVAYWTPETRRATRLEKKPRRFYKFAEYGGK